MKEIGRIEGFEHGNIPCVKCGKPVHLYFNGGELDESWCCFIRYKTEYSRVDLVISK